MRQHLRFRRWLSLPLAAVLFSCTHTTVPETARKESKGVRPENLLYSGRPRASSKKAYLSRRDVSVDIAQLTYALDHAYAGRALMPPDDFELAHFAFRTLLRRRGGWERAEFCERLDDVLRTLPDASISAGLNGEPCSLERREQRSREGLVGLNFALVEDPSTEASERQSRQLGSHHDKRTGDRTSKPVPDHRDDPKSSRQSAGATAPVRVPESKPWLISHVEAGGQRIPVVAMTLFPEMDESLWHEFTDAFETALQEAPALIIDWRGNKGGDETWGRRLAARLYGLETPPRPATRVVQRQHPATMATIVNKTYLSVERIKKQAVPVPAVLQERLKSDQAQLERARSGALPLEKITEFQGVSGVVLAGAPTAVSTDTSSRRSVVLDPRTSFAKPIRILVDRRCERGCEAALLDFELHPTVKRIGEATAGTVHFGNPGVLVLPRSGIHVQLPTQFLQFQDGRFFERSGIQPHLKVSAGGDALKAAQQDLSETLRSLSSL